MYKILVISVVVFFMGACEGESRDNDLEVRVSEIDAELTDLLFIAKSCEQFRVENDKEIDADESCTQLNNYFLDRHKGFESEILETLDDFKRLSSTDDLDQNEEDELRKKLSKMLGEFKTLREVLKRINSY